MGRAMLTVKEAGWIMRNVYPVMPFEDVIQFGQIMHKFSLGYLCAYIQEPFLKRVIELGMNHDLIRCPMFYNLCAKYASIQNRNNNIDNLYCIRFDNETQTGIKIRSIKMMRDLFRNNEFIKLVGKIFPDSLRDVKGFVEDGVCVGPYPTDIISAIKMIMGSGPYKVEKYIDQKVIEKVAF